MENLIDTSVWIDFFRPQTPKHRKIWANEILNKPDSYLCEVVRFELLRAVPKRELKKLENFLETFPQLTTPTDLWTQATLLSQHCQSSGFHPTPLDLLIAQTARHHDAQLITFDRDFVSIGKISNLKVSFIPMTTAH